jgi:hypothetical protein
MDITVCKDIKQGIESNVLQGLEQCVKKDPTWWGCVFCLCCDIWLCAIAWFLVTIITWVIVTVCTVITIVVWVLVTIITSIIDIIVGLVTGDWSRLVNGLLNLATVPFVVAAETVPILSGGTFVGMFMEQSDRIRLENYVRGKVNAQFAEDPALRDRILDALGLNGGGFGLRLDARVFRLYVRSDTVTGDDGVPNLIKWNEAWKIAPGSNDLVHLANFDPPFAQWDRKRTVTVGTDGGSVTQDDVQKYIDNGGVGPDIRHFVIYAMSEADLDVRTQAATLHGREIGLELRWTASDQQAEEGGQVVVDSARFPSPRFPPVLKEPPFNLGANLVAAREELGSPLFLATFSVFDGTIVKRGISANFAGSACGLPADQVTGGAFKSWAPEMFAKYTLIHELGHTFGLCHVAGLTRIMWAQDSSITSVQFGLQYWTNGLEAGFDLGEAKQVWDYILANFLPERLATRAF